MTYHSGYADYTCTNCELPFFPTKLDGECPKCDNLAIGIPPIIVDETLTAALFHRDFSDGSGESAQGYIMPGFYMPHGLADIYIITGLFALNSFEDGKDRDKFAKNILNILPFNFELLEDHMVEFIKVVLDRKDEVEPFQRLEGNFGTLDDIANA